MISANALSWIRLTLAIGTNKPKHKALAAMYHPISDLLQGGEREWSFCGVMTRDEMNRLGSADNEKRAQAIIKRCIQLGYSILTMDDPAYPQCLTDLYAPPAVLYINGKLPDFNNRLSLGIVGTRSASRYGIANSYKFAYALSKYETIIVSGGALGVDCASHRGALAAGGVTVCVRGCGINSSYLKENKGMRQAITQNGAVISEYPPDETARKYYFPARNRLISALSDGLLVIEAGVKSGSLITANISLDLGRDVFALMGNNSAVNIGSNRLIKEGAAYPVTDFMDILAYYDSKVKFSALTADFDSMLRDINAIPVKGNPETNGRQNADNVYKMEEKGKAEKAKARKKSEKPAKTAAGKAEQPAPPKPELTGDAKRIVDYLSAEPVHIDTLADGVQLPVSRVLSTLTLLEMQGYVRALQGRKFVLK